MPRLLFLLLAAVAFLAEAQYETFDAAMSMLMPDSCCAALALGPFKDRLLFPGQPDYESRLKTHFDQKQQNLRPNCIVQPQSAKEVALAVETLTDATNPKPCKFAIRSGGHGQAGSSNIDEGVTLDLRYLNEVDYDAENGIVNVGPGATWDDVFTTLEPLGVMITGGRSSTVGVGGLTLGGGISYYSAEHGLVCDNILEFEVVLADGRVVNASGSSNADLFAVLKGGGNNFGIVTNFRFPAFKYEGMWGGLVAYPEETIQDHFRALVNFINKIDKNPKASAIVTAVYQSRIGAVLAMNFYDFAAPVARASAYDEFLAIPGNLSDSTGFRNLSSLAQEWAGATTHSVYFGTLTFANDLRVMTKAHEVYLDVLSEVKTKAKGDWFIYTLYQPLPPAYWKKSAEKGGNMLNLERFDGQPLCLYLSYLAWQGAEQDALFREAGKALEERIDEYARSIGADTPYLYFNYADKAQDPLSNYGAENISKMKAAAKKYDPSGVFQELVPGGFKISNVK